jgi:hypothetical protein
VASFSERVEVLIDVINKNSGALTALKSDVAATEGALNKAQTAGSSFGSMIASQSGLAVAGVAGAGLAIGKFALDSVEKFGNLGDSVLQFERVVGTSAQESSKWVSVLGQFGVSAEQGSASIGKLAKTLGNNIDALDKFGVEVAKNKDGTVDLAGTLENIITTYQGTQDETTKAALAQSAFGRSWQALVPILNQSAGALKTAFDSVPKGDILSQKDADTAENMNVEFKRLGQAVQSLEISLGKELAPVLVELAKDMDNLVTQGNLLGINYQKQSSDGSILSQVWHGMVQGLGELTGGYYVQKKAAEDNAKAADDASKAHLALAAAQAQDALQATLLTGAFDGSTPGYIQAAIHADDVTAAQNALANSVTHTAEQIDAQAKSLDKLTAAMQTQENAGLDSVGAQRNLEKAQLDMASSVDGSNAAFAAAVQANLDVTDAVNKHGAASKEAAKATDAATKAQESANVAADSLKDKILTLAGAAGDLAAKQAEAAGQTFSASQKIDAQRVALVGLEKQFPALAPIIDGYIAQLDQIPREKTTDAHFHAEGLQAILDQYQSIKDKTVSVHVAVDNNPSVSGKYAHGGYVKAAAWGGAMSGVTLVGEEGPELVQLPMGSFVYTAAQTTGMLAGVGGGGGGTSSVAGGSSSVVGGFSGGDTYYVTVNVRDPGPDAVIAAVEKWRRRNGPRPWMN